ncbi:MAG: class I tRNA ligase family protein [Candidatus Kaiserbacteria bacterium]|nr:class I tRNA ligase family protein [Candidatus Kaiserbacteria bacterium]MCB9815994.1 class I tRNA ligase family protein [Candidatus Nomurabacteria bacterium]
MHKKFDHKEIEKKWQEKWQTDGLYDTGERDNSKEKEYVLVEWPYPSGNLHIGHWYAFAVPDIYVRYKRMVGTQVLYPMGFDAFGLPAENAAIKRNLNPREWTESNIEYMRGQLASMGNAFSWDKTCNSTDPEYYKWTQWMFTKFFENNIAYRGEGVVNWCPGCNTVIANEQVQADGTCERCDSVIEKKKMPQWMLRITDFADELIDDLAPLNWPEHIKDAQRNWIGRSEGAEIDFELSVGEKVTVFTTRPDTLFGATYLVLAPEHELIEKYKDSIINWDEVVVYAKEAKQKAEQDRLDNTKEKTGVKLDGITATNPANGEEIPVYIADYVLAGYGTGAIMAVPAHDERDHAFAKKYRIQIKSVVTEKPLTHAGALLEAKGKPGTFLFQLRKKDAAKLPGKLSFFGGKIESEETPLAATKRELEEELEFSFTDDAVKATYCFESEIPGMQGWVAHITDVDESSLVLHEGDEIVTLTIDEAIEDPRSSAGLVQVMRILKEQKIRTEYGVLVDSGEFTGLTSEEAKVAITEKVSGKLTNTYRLRDWSIGRQRYWGVPIPIVYDPEGRAHPIAEEHLPWTLPEDVDFKPTGVAPLAKSEALKRRVTEIFGEGWTPEVETMDTFVDSSWYYLRYIDNKNDAAFSSKEAQQTWLPIDLYFGGAEHTTMHLLYSRFWQKALKRLGLAEHAEPYARRINRGLILGPDGNKMSKSKGNVIDPDEQVERVGADTVKMYLAFMGPYGETANYPWDMGGIAGLRRFLERVYGLSEHITENEPAAITSLLHKTIKKVDDDIKNFKFNTAISAMMILVNDIEKQGIGKESYELFLRMLAPFAPHVTEELWQAAGNSSSIHSTEFPAFDPDLAKDKEVTIGVQINGKVRGDITVSPEATEVEVMATVAENHSLQARIKDAQIRKIIYVPGRILNLVVSE